MPVILIIDGHSSHLTLDVFQKCEELEICLIKLFSNSTFLSDVSCFKSLKVSWKKIVSDFKKNKITRRVQKSNFAGLMKLTENAKHDQLKQETVMNGFLASGIQSNINSPFQIYIY